MKKQIGKMIIFILIISIQLFSCIAVHVGDRPNLDEKMVNNYEYSHDNVLIIISVEHLSKRLDYYSKGASDQVNVTLNLYQDSIDACEEVIKKSNIFSDYKILFNFHSSLVKGLEELQPLRDIMPDDYVNLDMLNKQFATSKSEIAEYKQLKERYENEIAKSVKLYDKIIYINMRCYPLYDESNFYHNPSMMLGCFSFLIIPWHGETHVMTDIIVYDKAKELKNQYSTNYKEMAIAQLFLLPAMPFFVKNRVHRNIMHDSLLETLIKCEEEKIFR